MRYAIFTDIHANLEALEAVLAAIDEESKEEKIDQIWFLGDLVGYGPNPNECIDLLRSRTDVIIAGNHDWAAVGKLDLEDFSAAARISAEWTADELTEEHREFLRNLPEHLEMGECTLVHGSPYGPLWEYLTSEVLAERSFQHFSTRFCVVGHTHVPVIFQQPDTIANEPTAHLEDEVMEDVPAHEEEETAEMAAVILTSLVATGEEKPAYTESRNMTPIEVAPAEPPAEQEEVAEVPEAESPDTEELVEKLDGLIAAVEGEEPLSEGEELEVVAYEISEKTTPETEIKRADDRSNDEIEELLELLGLSQSLVKVTNEMFSPPEGVWQPPEGYRAIINPGGVGQPRDGDPRPAFMIYDSERVSFDFHRIEYNFEKTQEKIIQAGLPQYLAIRLAYGR